ncbi:phosphoribosylformylglycinamidine synthase subunit PurL, partial [Candidatus Omnitrophota bacterium]
TGYWFLLYNVYRFLATGKDGIGGCSVLASQEFGEGDEKRPSVQIGDPFTEKCLIEATIEALRTGHIVGIKDMGAAGLTCSSSEMAAAGESGMEIELEHVPRREENMEPWEVMMSESQERMLVCVKKGHEKEILSIFHKWDLNASIIGQVIKEKVMRVKDKGEVVAEIPFHCLANAPIYDMPYIKPPHLGELRDLKLEDISEPSDYNEVLTKMMRCHTIANKRWIYQQYDHMVQTNTVVLPGSDAAVIRLKGTKKSIAATSDCNSRYCFLNPFRGAQIAVAEAARNLTCSGADPAAVTDCLNFGNPEKPDRYWYFKNAVEGIVGACKSFRLAVISGNVSFYNESPQGAIYPTPTIGMVGIITKPEHVTTQYFKNDEDIILLLGESKEELGGSEYLKSIHNLVKGDAPELDLKAEKDLQSSVLEAIREGLVNSAHDCSEGGLGVALAECCISGEKIIGAKIDLKDKIRQDTLLFGESQSRIIISCDKKNVAMIQAITNRFNVPCSAIGKTGGEILEIKVCGKKLVDSALSELNKNWRNSIEDALNVR